MITDIVQLSVSPARECRSKPLWPQLKPVFARAKGCKAVELLRSIETAESYRLVVLWETMENNSVHFRQSPDHKQVGGAVRDLLAAKPVAAHFNGVAKLLWRRPLVGADACPRRQYQRNPYSFAAAARLT